ncbi:MAG: sugar ABC transporter ATP-binding protein [Armatimonadetes bacterium]|nr:sugar ABC transporter ATP-binding protein [Armatimonadota bacterium]
MSDEIALEVRGLSKRFGGVRALRSVSISVRRGECHGLVGANGAGKSTLAKVIAGVLQPDDGEVVLFGKAVRISSPSAAERLGIGLVPQEPMMAPNLSVAENLALGREHTRGGMLDKAEERRKASELLARVGLADLSPDELVGALTVADRQLVQLARALGAAARLLILDEPTSAITAREAEDLFAIMATLQRQGVTVIYVSHRLEEVLSLCDSITVLRDGQVAGVFRRGQVTEQQIIEAMAGSAGVEAITAERTGAERERPAPGEVVLEVRHLSRPPAFRDVSFSVRAGEVLGIAGLVGAGRSEIVRAIAGIDRPASGEVLVDGRPAQFASAAQAIARGVVLLPEDRQLQGIVPQLGVRHNISLSILSRLLTSLGLLNVARERALAAQYVDRLSIQCADIDQPVRQLSGGNQQKVMVARTVSCEPRVILLDEPTRGVDVAAKADIHRLIREFARQGMAVVLISSELQEVAALSDRILVLRDGRVRAELSAEGVTEPQLLALAATGDSGT